jgi:hypothetical protein
MSFFYGFGDELVKLSFKMSKEEVLDFVKKNPEVARAGAKGFGEGAGGEVVRKAGPSVAGAAVGGLAGKTLFRRGALGALAGLGIVHRKKLLAAAKKAKEKAEELRSKK